MYSAFYWSKLLALMECAKPNLGVAVLEDALAIGGGILIVALAAPLRT